MAWATTRPTGVIVERSLYYEYRPDPNDEDELERRKRERVVTEFRGMTFSAATGALSSAITQSGTETETLSAQGGGGYTITQVSDFAAGSWTAL